MKFNRNWVMGGLSLALIGVLAMQYGSGEDKKPQAVYELRTYTTPEGKLPELHKRFREHTMKLFEKHGMKNVIYLVPTEGDNTLVYLLKHESLEAAKKSWDAFRTDPEWIKARSASEVNGSLVSKVESKFFTATNYSPMK